jgi:hypothetical protein
VLAARLEQVLEFEQGETKGRWKDGGALLETCSIESQHQRPPDDLAGASHTTAAWERAVERALPAGELQRKERNERMRPRRQPGI